MDSKIRIKTAALKDRCAERVKTIWIRPILFGLLSMILCLMPSCKTNNWADWKTQNELWLLNNAKKDSVETTSSGLQYKIISDPMAPYGDAKPNSTSTIRCDYSVKLINGYVVDSRKNYPVILSQTIPGFAEGCHKIHNKGTIEMYIPAYLGYDYEKYNSDKYNKAEGMGTEGTTGYIPPYSTLIYHVEISAIVGN